MKAILSPDDRILNTLRVLLLGMNKVTDKYKEQLWKCAVIGFPRAIIGHEYSYTQEEPTSDTVQKLNDLYASEPPPGKEFFSFQLRIVAIEYIKKLAHLNRLEEFIELCKGGKGYFCRVPKDCIKIIEKKLEDYNRPTQRVVLAFMRVFREIMENCMLINDVEEKLSALAIALRINITFRDHTYKSSMKGVNFALKNTLDFHKEEINV